MTFLEMYGARLDLKLASTDRTERFTTALRKTAINEGIARFTDETNCYVKRASIALTDGTGEYDLETSGVISGEDYLRPAAVSPSLAITTTATGAVRYIEGDDLPRVGEDALNHAEAGWRAAGAATPTGWYLRRATGVEYVGLSPAPDIPSTETWALLWPYVAIPPTLSADADLAFSGRIALFPYHDAIVAYAAAQMEELRKNYAMVDRRLAEFAAAGVRYRRDQAPVGGSRIRLATNWRARLRPPYPVGADVSS